MDLLPLALRRPLPPITAAIAPPSAVMLYLDDFCGALCQPLVRAGQRVRRGEPVGAASCGAQVHASVSGVVRAVGSSALVIENDGRDTPDRRIAPLACLEDVPREPLLQRLPQLGLLTYDLSPLPQKLQPCHALALAVLSDADFCLFQVFARQIFGGIRALATLLRPRRLLLYYDPKRAPAAETARLLKFPGELQTVDGRCPQLAQRLAGRSLERGVTLGDLGLLVFSPQGAAALWDAIYLGEPYLRMGVVIAGEKRRTRTVCTVPLGTSVAHILAQAHLSAPTVLLGSQETGRILRDPTTPLNKGDTLLTCLGGV